MAEQTKEPTLYGEKCLSGGWGADGHRQFRRRFQPVLEPQQPRHVFVRPSTDNPAAATRPIITVRRALPPLPQYRRRQLPALARSVYDHLTGPASHHQPPTGGPVPLSPRIPLPCPKGCPDPLTVHSQDLGCWLCDCTYGQP